ncbi:MAG TPA: hypothetical protein VGN81_13865 [Pseudonocardiaceae bacterium]|jgi:hypothetical protein
MTDFSSIDFTMPQGISPDDRVAWLHEIGRQLRDVSGQQSGTTPQLEVGQQQPAWFMWWGD